MLSLQLRGQEVQVIEVVVTENVTLGRLDAYIGIREVLIGGTVAIGVGWEPSPALSTLSVHDTMLRVSTKSNSEIHLLLIIQ